MDQTPPLQEGAVPSVAIFVAGVVNGALSAGAVLVMILLSFNLVDDPDWAWGAMILWFGIGASLGIGYNTGTPRSRWFWVLSAFYNVAALVVWAPISWATHPVLSLIVALWILFMVKLSVQEAWIDRASSA